MLKRGTGVLPLLLLCLASALRGQERGSPALGSLIQGLSVSGRVLVIAAHPDDEDTQLITWLAKGRHVETAYLSLTRGDGGQNLLGNELGDALGAIRTEELLAARRIDGGRQYFTRAYDFGFSKTAEETYSHWPHDSVLRDVITVVRAFRPHVIVAVFSGTPRDGHGHHQVSGLLAKEAYELAGDTARFPRAATAGLDPWTVTKFYRRTRQEPSTVAINVGEYDPLLGRSYGELSDLSRSQHKSQAFGSLERKGVRIDGVRLDASRAAAPNGPELGHFDGIDTTWARFRSVMSTAAARAALDSLPAAFNEARAKFDAFAPERSVPSLARVQRLLDRLCAADGDGAANACHTETTARSLGGSSAAVIDLAASVGVARERVDAALALASGVAVEATAAREVWALAEPVPVSLTVYNRGRIPVSLVAYRLETGERAVTIDAPGAQTILPDSTRAASVTASFDAVTQPWWLARPRSGAVFATAVRGVEEGTPARNAATAAVALRASDALFTLRVPVVYRYADPLKGEQDKPIAGAPAVAVTLDHEVEYVPANSPIERVLRVHLTSASSQSRDVDVTIKVPNGLLVDSATRRVTLPAAGVERTIVFNVRGRLTVGRHTIQAVATSGGESFSEGYSAIAYDHIRTQRLYRPSALAVEAVDLKVPPRTLIAYIAGVGDNVEPTLEQLGIDVVMLDPASLPRIDLSKFSAIVVGSRAYEASPSLVANNANLLDYVKNGGTAVVQYGQGEMQRPGMMPYPITLVQPADRVTVENAPVTITVPSASILNAPNRITAEDFKGWQQDLSLYMPRTFDPKYASILEMNDPGEPPNKGAILVAPYGKGTYVYTTLAFFRQLPNGIPGAARLFVNLLAAKADRVSQ